MAEEKTYLELSEGNSHKFYEITIDGMQVVVRYGRIGDKGQIQTANYPTPEKALAEAAKKINEKIKKGYERAVIGVRKKRSVTRRSMDIAPSAPQQRQRAQSSQSSSSSASAQQNAPRSIPKPQSNRAPIIWQFDSGSNAFGIFVDESLCWVGNEAGQIFALDHSGQMRAKFKLPEGVKCIVADDDWLYAGCDDGNVYDLSGKSPRIAYQINEDIDIYWLDVKDGILAVSDSLGNVTTINHEDESQWTKKSKGEAGWMVRCDEIGVYHGHLKGVTMYDWEDGRVIWEMPTHGQVLFGWQEESTVYACTADFVVHCFTKKGDKGPIYQCDAPIFSCAAAENGKYIFAGDNRSQIYCFNESGERLWELSTGCGSAFSMQFFKDRLYIVTTQGMLACIDASEAAIKAAQEGSVPEAVSIKASQAVEEVSATVLETTSDRSGGVLVECFKEGGKLRVRVVAEGYKRDWHCQFPKGIREEDAHYIVDEVRESNKGGFYRVFGNIKKLER